MADETTTQQGGGAGAASGTQAGDNNNNGAGQTPPASFDDWLKGQGEDVKGLVASHTGKLQNALQDERLQRKAMAKQVEELSKAAESGSQLKAQLDKISADMTQVSQKAAFYESAPADCTNVRLAFLAASDAGLLGSDGKVDWGKLKAGAPELFRKVVPAGNPGSGASTAAPGEGKSMNTFLRTASGRGG